MMDVDRLSAGGFWRRFCAWWLDSVIVSVATLPLALLLHMFRTVLIAQSDAKDILIGLLLGFLYFGIMNSRIAGGQTLGKRLVGLQVVDRAGIPVSVEISMLRSLLLILLEIGGFLGLLVAALHPRKRGLHDMIAGTYVIRTAAQDTMLSRAMLPIGRSGHAIAAGYLGLLSPLVIPAPFAILFGALALRKISTTPGLGGVGRAWFGVISGLVVCIGMAFFLSGP